MPADARGSIQVRLPDTNTAMWWSVVEGRINQGWGALSKPDVEISGFTSTYLLAVAGRRTRTEATQSRLHLDGDLRLGQCFLASWRLI
jgi:hypothetical protein